MFLLSSAQSVDIPQQIPFTVANVGDNVTMSCPMSLDQTGLLYWYKQKFGYAIQTVAKGSYSEISLERQFNSSRFEPTTVNALHILHIRYVCKEDEATYFCHTGTPFEMKINATVLFVNGKYVCFNAFFFVLAVSITKQYSNRCLFVNHTDHKNEHKSVYVKQSPETELVQPGDLMNLQCSLLFKNKGNHVKCPGTEHSVYWFRTGSGTSHASTFYTHNGDEEEKRSCVYSMSKTIRNSSDIGIYYCAVLMCGEILFGNGTTVRPSTF